MKRVAMSTEKTEVLGRLWLNRHSHNFLGHGRIELLEKIVEYGSISQAAKAMRMSYKAAWDAIDAMNNLSPHLLVLRNAGGKGGGGTQVTEYGKQLINLFKEIEAQHDQFLCQLSEKFVDFEKYYDTIGNIIMQTSARNEFLGTVDHIKYGPINAEVVIQLKGNEKLVAVITQNSAEYLALKEGSDVYALIKALQVYLMPLEHKLKVSARNCLTGTVVAVTMGPVNSEVTLELASGNTLKAVVTKDAFDELGIKTGVKMCGFFKASNVILAVKE